MTEGPPGIPGEQGPQGVRGTQGRRGIRGVAGQQGERGMTAGARHAIVFLFFLTLAFAILNLLYATRIDHQSRARDQQVNRNSAALIAHTHHDDELRGALCAALPALARHAGPVAGADVTRLERTLSCHK